MTRLMAMIGVDGSGSLPDLRIALALACFLAVSGCASPGPIFPPIEPPIVWPKVGDPARYAWVGKLEGEADLAAPRSFWRRMGDAVFGREPQARIQGPHEVAVDGELVYVTDPEMRTVHLLDLERREHQALTDAGQGRRFEAPSGLAVLGDRVAVADRALKTITLLSMDGEPEAVLGEKSLEAPVGVAIGPVTKRIYVADVGLHRVKGFDPGGRVVFSVGGRGPGLGQFNYPTHVACDAQERIYVSDSLNFRIQVFDRQGKFLRTWGSKGDQPGEFSQPKGLAVDRAGRVYVVDSNFENVQVFDPQGRLLLAFGEEGNGPGQFWLPVGICVDGRDRIWVGDLYNRRVQVFRFLGAEPSGAKR